MNFQKMTQKSIDAVRAAQDFSVTHGNQELKEEHLLYALLTQEEGLIPSLLEKMNKNTALLKERAEAQVAAFPRVAGLGADRVFLSGDLDKAVRCAESEADKMKDAYVSVEHLFLGLLKEPSVTLKKLFQEQGITQAAFLSALKEVRGGRSVNSENPEATYDVLKKYGQDLTALARAQKLDPVIGRDEEIRNVVRILSRKSKNNPCLIGDPGVGQTAIAEGLANRIVQGDVPENLK
ncbi:MAG: type VI secretion system ATPase TssH, partial [Clostridia bacterium]|nr:type VI secretion system ATPase TssH [Clostridia bacterium]